MRTSLLTLASLAALCFVAPTAQAGHGHGGYPLVHGGCEIDGFGGPCGWRPSRGHLFGGHGACGCGAHGCGGHGCGAHGCGIRGHRCIEGLDPNFNCGCRGSYNYPVPPQYTYHWPGMYKQARMTDYVSPWRFPPIRPYTEERLEPLLEETSISAESEDGRSRMKSISHSTTSRRNAPIIGQPQPLSRRLQQPMR